MTDKEGIEQKVRLSVEIEDANTDLVHEKERVLRLADDLELWVYWLRGNASKQPSAADFAPIGVQDANLRSDGRYRECLDFVALLKAEEGLRKARQKCRITCEEEAQ